MRMVDPEVPLVPPRVAGFASSCGDGEVALGESFDLNDGSLVERANSAWWRIAVDGGLFQENDRRFLVAVQRRTPADEDCSWWAEVELLDEWDLAGAGAQGGVLGLSRGRPAFTMLSLSGEVVLRVTCGETNLDVVLIVEPYRIEVLRGQAEFMAGWRGTGECTAAAVRRWLGANA